MNGKEVSFPNVKSAIKAGLAYVTEDRKGNGLILSESICKNTTAAKPEKISKHWVLNFDKERQYSEQMAKDMHTKCATVMEDVGNLSGGNMQKVLLGKWLFAEPDILILDEPTRGIDVGAKYEIYKLIHQLADEGKAVILVSSELPELLGMADRIYTIFEGTITGEIDSGEASQEGLMKRMTITSN
jgi:putative multiple sugar transport system ATP-binding protein